jgi:hypothetical protein
MSEKKQDNKEKKHRSKYDEKLKINTTLDDVLKASVPKKKISDSK